MELKKAAALAGVACLGYIGVVMATNPNPKISRAESFSAEEKCGKCGMTDPRALTYFCDMCHGCEGCCDCKEAESFMPPVHKDECTVCVGFADLKDLGPDYEVFLLCEDCITKAKTMPRHYSAESWRDACPACGERSLMVIGRIQCENCNHVVHPDEWHISPMYRNAESFSAELKKDSCCCGATTSKPCTCMVEGKSCSGTCACASDKKAESMGRDYRYRCNYCGEEHDEDDMSQTVHVSCPHCGEDDNLTIIDLKMSAEAVRSSRWECSKCGADFDDEEEAEECCPCRHKNWEWTDVGSDLSYAEVECLDCDGRAMWSLHFNESAGWDAEEIWVKNAEGSLLGPLSEAEWSYLKYETEDAITPTAEWDDEDDAADGDAIAHYTANFNNENFLAEYMAEHGTKGGKSRFMDPKQVIDLFKKANGTLVSVTFVKRTNGEVRKMLARTSVRKGVKGVGLKFKPSDKNLMGVYDFGKVREGADPWKCYRFVPVDAVLSMRVRGKTYTA